MSSITPGQRGLGAGPSLLTARSHPSLAREALINSSGRSCFGSGMELGILYKIFFPHFRLFDRKSSEIIAEEFYEKKFLCGLKLFWSNGSTDVAGETEDENTKEDLELFTVSLSEGEHIQRLDLICTPGPIEKLKLISNKGKVFGGCEGGPEKNTNRNIRSRGVNPKHVYLDGIRGDVVRGNLVRAKALKRISFKWSFVMDKMESQTQTYYHQPTYLPSGLTIVRSGSKSEKISVLDLEKDINLSEEAEGLTGWIQHNRSADAQGASASLIHFLAL